MNHDVIGAVLAGGRGHRIGGDKPSLEVGDKTLVRYAVDALRSVGLEVALVLRPDQPAPLTAHTIATVRDEIEDAGPLAGLQALLRWLPVEWAVVVACDQPFLAPPLLRGLLAQPRDSADVVLPEGPNGPEPLPGLYRRTCLPDVDAALARGERSLRELVARLRSRQVPQKQVRRWDPDLVSFVNVNTPDDLERARASVAPFVADGRYPGRALGDRR